MTATKRNATIVVLVVGAGLVLLVRKCGQDDPPAKQSAAATQGSSSAPQPASPPRIAPPTADKVDDPKLIAEIGKFAAKYLGDIAGGDAEKIRSHFSGEDLFAYAQANDEMAQQFAGMEHTPLPADPAHIRTMEDLMISALLDAPPQERADFAKKAVVRDVLRLSDGTYFIRLRGDDVLRFPPGGRATGVADPAAGSAKTGSADVPPGAVRTLKEMRMQIGQRQGAWKIVAFPRLDQQPKLDP
jgi:hypothetical protein